MLLALMIVWSAWSWWAPPWLVIRHRLVLLFIWFSRRRLKRFFVLPFPLWSEVEQWFPPLALLFEVTLSLIFGKLSMKEEPRLEFLICWLPPPVAFSFWQLYPAPGIFEEFKSAAPSDIILFTLILNMSYSARKACILRSREQARSGTYGGILLSSISLSRADFVNYLSERSESMLLPCSLGAKLMHFLLTYLWVCLNELSIFCFISCARNYSPV